MCSAVSSGLGGLTVSAWAYSDTADWYSRAACAGFESASTCAASANAAETRPTRFGLIFPPGLFARNTGRCAAAYRLVGSVSWSSFSGSRQMSWSPVKVPASLPEPMPTWKYSVLVFWSHTWSSQRSPKCASLSNVDGAAAPRARSEANSRTSPYAVVWVNFR